MSTLMKKRKMSYKNATLATKVAKLQRQVSKTKPEVKQFNGPLVIANGTAALYPPCIVLTQGVGASNRLAEEIRLHKIIVRGIGGAGAGIGYFELFKVNTGFPLLTPALDTVLLGELDRTKYTVLARTQMNTSKCTASGSAVTGIIEVSKKFTIPMIVRFDGVTTTATTNQIYVRWVSSAGTQPVTTQNCDVSLYYTDS